MSSSSSMALELRDLETDVVGGRSPSSPPSSVSSISRSHAHAYGGSTELALVFSDEQSRLNMSGDPSSRTPSYRSPSDRDDNNININTNNSNDQPVMSPSQIEFRTKLEKWASWGLPLSKVSWLILLGLQIFSCFLIMAINPNFFSAQYMPTSNSTAIPASSGGVMLTPLTDHERSSGIAVMVIFGLIQVLVMVFATIVLYYEIMIGMLPPMSLISMYLGVILLYAHLYMTCFIIDLKSLSLAPGGEFSYNVFAIWIAFLYLSSTIITTVGLGDVLPVYWFPKFISVAEMITGLVYSACIFAIGVDHFRLQAHGKRTAPKVHFGIASFFRTIRTKFPQFDKVRRFVIRWVFPLSFSLQVFLMLMLYAVDSHVFEKASASNGAVILVMILEILQFIIIVFMTLSLVRQINTSFVSPTFLLQSYLSTCTLFAGIYLAVDIAAGHRSFHLNQDDNRDSIGIAETVGECVWMSIVLMTTTGFGDVYPLHPIARLLVIVQMLCSVFYSVVILGLGMAHVMGAISSIRDEKKKLAAEQQRSQVSPVAMDTSSQLASNSP